MTTKNILRICCDIMGRDITEKRKTNALVFLRAVYYRVCFENGFEKTDMARSCGKRHATSIHGLKIFDRDIVDEKSKFHKPYFHIYRDCSAAVKAAIEMEREYADKIEELTDRIERVEKKLKIYNEYDVVFEIIV